MSGRFTPLALTYGSRFAASLYLRVRRPLPQDVLPSQVHGTRPHFAVSRFTVSLPAPHLMARGGLVTGRSDGCGLVSKVPRPILGAQLLPVSGQALQGVAARGPYPCYSTVTYEVVDLLTCHRKSFIDNSGDDVRPRP
jgi:hypothetical protein